MNESTEGHNLLFIGISLVSLLFHSRPAPPSKPVEDKDDAKKRANAPEAKPNSFVLAVSFGSTFFWTHTYLTDAETIGRWIVQGHPNTGPTGVVSAIGVALAIFSGLVLASLCPKIVRSGQWWVAGSVAALGFYFLAPCCPNVAYLSGCIFATYATSLWFPLLERMGNCVKIARTLSGGMLVFVLLTFMQMYTVAYAFVPYGNILRERSWVVFATNIAVQLVFVKWNLSTSGSYKGGVVFSRKWVKVSSCIFFWLLAMSVLTRLQSPYYSGAPPVKEKNISDYVSPLIESPLSATVFDELGGLPVITAGIWTIHFALDMDMLSSHVRMRNLIEAVNFDFIGLLESDTQRVTMGNRDVVQYLGEVLNMYVDYGPSTRDHTWGCSFLSKYPILRSTHHLLPSPGGELACAIHATALVNGREIDFLISHNGQEEDKLDRVLQTTEISRIINSSSNPTVFLGYVVASPKSPNYYLLMKKETTPISDETFSWKEHVGDRTSGSVFDIDPSDSDRWCQYVGYRGPGLARLSYARVHHNHITDTELQTAKFLVLPRDPTTTSGSPTSTEDGVARTSKAVNAVSKLKKAVKKAKENGKFGKLPAYYQSWVYPSDFYKLGGWRGHYLHTFKHYWEME